MLLSMLEKKKLSLPKLPGHIISSIKEKHLNIVKAEKGIGVPSTRSKFLLKHWGQRDSTGVGRLTCMQQTRV